MSVLSEQVAALESKVSTLQSDNTARKNEVNRLQRKLDEEISNMNLQMQNLMKRVERTVRR